MIRGTVFTLAQARELSAGCEKVNTVPKPRRNFMKAIRPLFYLLIGVIQFSAVANTTTALPAKFDLRQKLGGLPPIKDQKTCGSDWAFTITSAFETAIKMKEGIDVSLSEQQLVSCNGKGYGCNGGWMEFDMTVNPGISLATDYPYVEKDTECNKSVPIFRQAKGSGKVAANDQDLKQAIYEYGSVAVAMYSGPEFAKYNGGVFKNCDGSLPVNHAVNLIGWNDEGGYWIVRNSWGARWGENGYFRIVYGCNRIGESATYVKY